MRSLDPEDVVLMAFPFSGGGSKRRPALVLADTGDRDIVVARITTQPYGASEDVEIRDWAAAGLLSASIVRVHKVATLERSLVERVLGRLTAADRGAVRTAVMTLFGSI